LGREGGRGEGREKHKEGRETRQASKPFFNKNGMVLYLAKGKRRFKVKSSHLFHHTLGQTS
jgi:hypothetical protein